MTPLETEALFSEIGLMPILTAKPRLTKYRFENAAAMPASVRRRVLRFLATNTFEEAHEAPPFDYPAVLDAVSKVASGDTDDMNKALFAAVPDRELATDLGLMAERFAAEANKVIPREPPNPVTLQPAVDIEPAASNDFARLWQVACDPLAVLDDLEDGSLFDEQVVTLAVLYPAIYADIRQAVTDAMATMIARRGKAWEPMPTKAAMIATLKQVDDFDAELAGFVQASFAAEAAAQDAAAPPPPERARRANGDSPEPTPGQRAAGT